MESARIVERPCDRVAGLMALAPSAVVGIWCPESDGGSFWAGDYETDAEALFHKCGVPVIAISYRDISSRTRNPTSILGRTSIGRGGRSSIRWTWFCPGASSSAAGSPRRALVNQSLVQESAISQYPDRGPSNQAHGIPAAGVRRGRLIPARCHARSGLSSRPEGPARTTCSTRLASTWPSRANRAGAAFMPTPSTSLILKPSGRARKLPSRSRPSTAVKRPGRRAGRQARPKRNGDQPRDPPAGLDRLASSGPPITTTRFGTVTSPCAAWPPTPQYRSISWMPSTTWERPRFSPAGRPQTDPSPSASNPVRRGPLPDSSTAPVSRCPDRAIPTDRT